MLIYCGWKDNITYTQTCLVSAKSEIFIIEMSLPNRTGILTPIDGIEEGEFITMLVMPVMLNS